MAADNETYVTKAEFYQLQGTTFLFLFLVLLVSGFRPEFEPGAYVRTFLMFVLLGLQILFMVFAHRARKRRPPANGAT